MNSHIPVMLTEVMDALQIQSGGLYIDATFGGGGHTREIVKRGGKVLAIDADPDAEKRTIKDLGGSITFRKGNFRDIREIAQNGGFDEVDGILFDLGLSSMEIDNPEKGFSFRFAHTPLDMRYSGEGRTAADFLKEGTLESLQEIFEMYGEEEKSREIAKAIYQGRSKHPLRTAGDLRTLIHESGGDDHSTARIFQALRIAVNDEIGALEKALTDGVALLKKNGRIVVLSYHSLEDRTVKRFTEREETVRWVTKKPMTPDRGEQMRNRRSRSAKMRILEKN
jgi:16S rRNA (cytosine1402-N4)-methyltransferase